MTKSLAVAGKDVLRYDSKREAIYNSSEATRDCYYQGYIETYTNSLVMLSACSGLSGLLLFENITYGIEPVESASGFQHLIYQTEYNDEDLNVSKDNYSINWTTEISQRANLGVPINFSTVRYVEMHVIVTKTLFDYMGSDEVVVTGKIMKLISFINTMFFKLNMRIVLSSLEFWIDNDKIPTTGAPEDVLGKFVEWKREHLALRPHDVSFLFVYRNNGDSLGSTFPKQICVKPSSAGIAVYQNGITLETFSIILAQLLGISLGLHFDNARQCFCPGSTCVMNTSAVQSSGAKFFSSCSINDFRNFLGFGSPQCLMNRPRIDITYRAPQCGNSIVEDGEQCDCGTECDGSICCLPDCTLKKGQECSQGECCWKNTCKVCMNQKCVERAVIKVTCNPETNCNKNGVCNNKGNCHCKMGWAPPDCKAEEKGGLGGSIDSTFRSGPIVSGHHDMTTMTRNWLLIGFFLFLPVAVGSVILIVKLRDAFSKVKVEEEEEEDEEEDYDTEGSKTQGVNQTNTASV